jgi:[ribosomal protein S5]-alanine N-acetyltransferase
MSAVRLFPALSFGFEPKPPVCDFGPYRLRMPEKGDFAAWAALRGASRAFLQPWEPSWPEDDLTPEAFRRRVARYRQERLNDSSYSFLLFRREEGVLLGGLTLAHIRRRAAMSANLGYWMGAGHAGNGIMSAAVPAICRLAFGSLGLERIEAACLPENHASIRVLEKAGFKREGFARAYLSIAGMRRDHLLFALLKSDMPRELPEIGVG